MSNNDYVPLSTEQSTQLDTEWELKPRPPRQASGPTVLQTTDPRFNPPSPSPLKRAALLLFVFCLFWFALRLRTAKSPHIPEEESYQQRKDQEHKGEVQGRIVYQKLRESNVHTTPRRRSPPPRQSYS